MYYKSIFFVLIISLISLKGFSQDTTHIFQNDSTQTTWQAKKSLSHTYRKNNKLTVSRTQNKRIQQQSKKPMYRDTRLGSSSPLYNTYKKNDYGAGAITTNAEKPK